MIRASFFMEQHVGHRTFYRNLRAYIDIDPRIEAHWIPITYTDSDSNWEKIPLLTDHIKGTLIGRQQVKQGWHAHESDVAFFFTQVPAVLSGRIINSRPYVLCTDLTPIQYDKMGEYYGHQPDSEGFLGSYKYRTNVKVFNNAAHILPWTNWAYQSFIDDYGVNPKNLTILPIGIDLTLWKPKEYEIKSPIKFLFVGGDFFRKGGDTLLEAFQQLPEGSAELLLATRSEVPEQDNVKVFNDLQPNSPALIELFRTSDVFVLPTKAEAFGIVAVEANASGLPVIMTDIGGVRDIIQDGETGFLLKSGDVEELVEKMCHFLENPTLLRDMGQTARKRVETYFNAQKNAAQIVDILLKVATKRIS